MNFTDNSVAMVVQTAVHLWTYRCMNSPSLGNNMARLTCYPELDMRKRDLIDESNLETPEVPRVLPLSNPTELELRLRAIRW